MGAPKPEGIELLETSPLFWIAFCALLIALVAFDLGVLGRQKGVIGVRQSLLLTAGYIVIALLLAVAVFVVKDVDAGMVARFAYLHYGLALVLVLVMIGIKMITEGFVEIPIWMTLGATVLLIGGSIALSIIRSRREAPAPGS